LYNLESDRLEFTQHENFIFPIFQHIRTYIHKKSVLSTISSSSSSSTRYFAFVFWSLIAIKVYDFCWYLILISIFLVVYKILKCLLFYIYTYFTAQACMKYIIQRMISFWILRRDVFIPIPLHLIIRCLRKFDKKINHAVQNSIDYLVSACMIMILLILIVFGTLFLLIQVDFDNQNSDY
jgi:hypothetical protein